MFKMPKIKMPKVKMPDVVGKAKDLNIVMWTLFILMSMFYLGPGDETTFEAILGNL